MRWFFHVLSIELRKTISYRLDFWLNLIGSVLSQFAVSYFLWKSIFEYNNVAEIRGYTFPAMIFYFFTAPFIEKATLGDGETGLSREIYDGGLSKLLLYPISTFGYKFAQSLAGTFIYITQYLLGLLIYVLFIGSLESFSIGAQSIFLFLLLILLARVISFLLQVTLESVAFWADNVWSLMVMLPF